MNNIVHSCYILLFTPNAYPASDIIEKNVIEIS